MERIESVNDCLEIALASESWTKNRQAELVPAIHFSLTLLTLLIYECHWLKISASTSIA